MNNSADLRLVLAYLIVLSDRFGTDLTELEKTRIHRNESNKCGRRSVIYRTAGCLRASVSAFDISAAILEPCLGSNSIYQSANSFSEIIA